VEAAVEAHAPESEPAGAADDAADRPERGLVPGAPHEDLFAELQQPRGAGAELDQGDRGAALLLERGGRREGRVCRQRHRDHGLRRCGARVRITAGRCLPALSHRSCPFEASDRIIFRDP